LNLKVEYKKKIDKFMKTDKLVVCCKVGTLEFIANILEQFIG